MRVVADSTLRIPPDASVLREAPERTLIVTTARAPDRQAESIRRAGARLAIAAADADGHVDMVDLVRGLSARGIGSLLVEGGAGIITSMLRARLCDRLVVCIAPRILGRGIEAVGDLGIARLADALTLTTLSIGRCGEDLIVDAALAAVAVA